MQIEANNLLKNYALYNSTIQNIFYYNHGFYASSSNDRGHIVLGLSVCSSVCCSPPVCLYTSPHTLTLPLIFIFVKYLHHI